MPVLYTRLIDGRVWSPGNPDAQSVIPRQRFEPETIYIPCGPFFMGAEDPTVSDWEQPRHSVDLPAFRIGRYPVTVREYAVFVKEEKDHPAPAGWFNREPAAGLADHPIVNVTWFDAMAYCAWLSGRTGRRYALPSEAEWERACGLDAVQGMLGNIQQWTRSLWGSQPGQPDHGYPYDPADGCELTDPAQLPAQARLVHRGGSFKSQPVELRCSARGNALPDSRIAWRGFRVAMMIA
jgi:formylglycine-generating enzyme required for sulfatase activity